MDQPSRIRVVVCQGGGDRCGTTKVWVLVGRFFDKGCSSCYNADWAKYAQHVRARSSMDRVADFESEGCGFESRRARHDQDPKGVRQTPHQNGAPGATLGVCFPLNDRQISCVLLPNERQVRLGHSSRATGEGRVAAQHLLGCGAIDQEILQRLAGHAKLHALDAPTFRGAPRPPPARPARGG